MLLPYVKREVALPLAEQLLKTEEDQSYLQGELDKIKEENPFIEEIIVNFSAETTDAYGAAFMGFLVYKLLKSQAEADEMNKIFGYEG